MTDKEKDTNKKEIEKAAENLTEIGKDMWKAVDFGAFFRHDDIDHTEIAAIVYKYFSGHRYGEIESFVNEIKRFNYERMKEHVCDYDKERWSYKTNLQKMGDMHDIIDSHLRKQRLLEKMDGEKVEQSNENAEQSNKSHNVLDKFKSFLD